MLLHLPDGYTPELVCDALAAKIKTLPEVLRASLTWDQGPEMRNWNKSPSTPTSTSSSATRTRPGSGPPTRTPTACSASTFRRAPTSRSTALRTSTGPPPNSTIGPANGSDSANRSNRSLTCCWLREDHPAQPLAPDHTSASFLIAASPDAAPEESRWSPRSRAAARRNDLDADQRQSTIRRRGRARTTNAKPSRPSSADALHTSVNHRGTIAASRVLRPPARRLLPVTGTRSRHQITAGPAR